MSIEEIRRRVHAAADGIEVPPPPADLLAHAGGSGVRRPGGRRGLGMALLAAASVVAAVGIGAVVVDRTADDPTSVGQSGRVDATGGALAAVALEHAGVRPDRIEALTEADLRYGRGTVGADIRLSPAEGEDGDLLRVTATPGRAPADLCADTDHCARTESRRGELAVSWSLQVPEEDPGVIRVVLQTDDAWHMAYYSGVVIDRDPREIEHLPVSVETMTAIVTDDRFGLRTTPEAVAAGDALRVMGEGEEPDTEGGALDDWEPRMVAGLVQEELGTVRSARESTYDEPAGPTGEGAGVHVELDFGTEFELLLVEEPGGDPLACPQRYECFRGDDRTVYGWTEAGTDLVVFRDRGDFAVRMYVHDEELFVDSREGFLDNTLVQLADLTDHPGLAPRMRADYVEVPVPGWSE